MENKFLEIFSRVKNIFIMLTALVHEQLAANHNNVNKTLKIVSW